MKYALEIELEAKPPMIQLNVDVPEPVIREFKFIAKQCKVSQTKVITEMLKEFVKEHRGQGIPKQRNIGY